MNVRDAPPTGGRADVSIREDGILTVAFIGVITEEVARQLLRDVERESKRLRAAGRPVYILIDISRTTGHTSLARSTAKDAARLDFDRGAAFGGTLAQGLIMQYLQRSISNAKARYYRRESDAMRWLLEGQDVGSRRRALSAVVAIALPLFLVLLVGALTYLSLANTRTEAAKASAALFHQWVDDGQDNLQRHMQVYVHTLYGFRGLFAASNSVERSEFRNYFNANNLVSDYPGFNAISFARVVKAADKTAYVNAVRHDTTLTPKGYPSFTITPNVAKDSYTVLEYVEPAGSSSSLGFDLSSSPDRQAALVKARDTGDPVATRTIDLVGAARTKGFFLTLPLYRGAPATPAERQSQLIGYVNAVFSYQSLFEDVLKDNADAGFGITVKDADGASVYSHPAKAGGKRQTETNTLSIGGQNFSITVDAPANFGESTATVQLPQTILTGGVTTALLLAVVMWQILRSRRHAITLAGSMTEDLEHERNYAVAVQHQLKQAEAALQREKASVERQVVERTAELAEAQARLTAAIAGLPFGFAVVDSQGKVALANRALLHLGQQRVVNEAAATQAILRRLTKNFASAVNLPALIQEAQASRKSITRHLALGEYFYTCYFHPITAVDKTTGGTSVVGTVLIIEDTTEAKAMERSREEFFSIASHELRTPLTAIMGNSDMMIDFYKDHLKQIPQLFEMVNDIHDASGRLITIVNDVLDMTSLEQGHTKFDLKPTDLRPLAEQIIRDYLPAAKAQKLSLKLEAPAGPVVALADSGKTHQVLVNVLSNALRFTEQGGITIKLEPAGKSVRVHVIDTGQGIPEEFRHLLFRKFQQASSNILTRDTSRSTGLGLYISQLIARGMNGRLYLKESTVGQGSAFTLQLAAADLQKALQK